MQGKSTKYGVKIWKIYQQMLGTVVGFILGHKKGGEKNYANQHGLKSGVVQKSSLPYYKQCKIYFDKYMKALAVVMTYTDVTRMQINK